ncbi:hypothetical protein BDP27DRAFT_1368085 [Rhodocollybia butyracea]|uniref:Uncharacterized protein n=1 Tax=Rhodocollybia butyracea TaxID=206335 RepID=A0A9P5PHG3_9AGAR|nr:hypothetical protein BDP27DRAFT_1368085 [Rhodocollybia butyracea]
MATTSPHHVESIPPPNIDCTRPLPTEVDQLLAAIRALSAYLSQIPSFQSRYDLVKVHWPKVSLWIVALLRTMDHYKDPSRIVNKIVLDTWGQFIVVIYDFLDITIGNSSPSENRHFTIQLERTPGIIEVLAQTWVSALIIPWEAPVLEAIVDVFARFFVDVYEKRPHLEDLPQVVTDVCPSPSGFSLFEVWIKASHEFSDWSSASHRQKSVGLEETWRRPIGLEETDGLGGD